MSTRTLYSSNTPWEPVVGYSRAVRVGNLIEVSGTVAADEHGNLIGEDDLYLQTQFILKKIEAVLLQAGASLQQVVRTRLFVTDISRWEEAARAHGEVFAEIRPCTTMVEVSRLIAKGQMIEIEATAVVEG
ncbi:RidA family protein [Flaviaesturariibacter aridisoli]|uniref:RidA family protein n=1 Tax=Flaviaesturariibacter aridisoli TaxID=2545761 RepID=A0A4R4DVC6_9BACT|nr:RidA family protein [Flaviaesturariibacter aridisoli]TCZ66424.1 RidA family protein [Flaviaesturariibacter aridisoli]